LEEVDLEDSSTMILDKNHDELPKLIKNPFLIIVFLGTLTLLTVSSNSILHSNEIEFILDRFVGISSFEFSLYDTVLYIAYFITGIGIGILSDKFTKRKIFILIGSASTAVLYFLMTLTENYCLLLFLRFLQGCFSIMAWQMFLTMVLDFSTQENRGRNMGIYGILMAIAMGLGPMVGGFIAKLGVFVPYYFAIGFMVLVFFLSFLLKEAVTLKQRSSLKESLLILKSDPKLLVPSLFNFIDRLHMGMIVFVLPLIIGLEISEGGLGLDTNYRGIAFGVFALPFILLQYPVGRISDKIGRYLPLILGSCFYGIVISLTGYFGSTSFSTLLILLVLLGFFSAITSPTSMALIGDTIEDNKKNAAGTGVFTLFGNIGIAFGPVIAGFLINYGFGLTFLIAGVLELFSLLTNIILIRFVFKDRLLQSKKIKKLNNTQPLLEELNNLSSERSNEEKN